ncbi:MAG: Clp protease N-terminal domain-containing protein [Ktedonobacteraceae bacterium]
MQDRDRFDKFTERARKVLSLAQEEAQRFQHNYIGTEHILLGLVREGEGVAARVLVSLGVELYKVRQAVEFIIGRGDRIVLGEIGLTPRAKKVIELAVDEARRLDHHYIGTEHLLLGLVREGEGIAAGVLESLGANMERVRRSTLAILNQTDQETVRTVEDTPSETARGGASTISSNLLMEWHDEDDHTLAPSSDADDPYDKFTIRARRCMTYAEEEARAFQHNYIGSEHLLLGLLHGWQGVAAHVLAQLGVKLEASRRAVEFIIGRGDSIVQGEIGLTPRAKIIIEYAREEASRLHHDYIGTEHLLLGLAREGEGIAAGALESMGVQLEHIIRLTSRVLGVSISPNVPDMSTAIPSPSSGENRFDRFTERARRVLSLAQEEAQRFQHNYIGTEHLLLGLVREGDCVAAKVLSNLGVELSLVRSAIEHIIGRGDRIVLGEIGLTPRARKVIDLSIDEARRLNHHYIGTEHLLLGLVREGEGIAAGVLESLGVNLEKVRMATISVLSGSGAAQALWKTDAETIVLIDQEVASSQDEDDTTLAPTREESEASHIPGAFSIRARRALDAAQEEAHKLQRNYVGTEHLLLGLISEEKGLAALILQKLQVDRETIRSAVEFIIAHSGSRAIPDTVGFTPRSQKVILYAVNEAGKLGETLVGTEHLLLGMLREGEGIAAGVLISLGVSYEKVYAPLARRRRQS